MMNQDNIHIMGMGIWWIVVLLIVTTGLGFIGVYIWKINSYRVKKGTKLELLRNRYLKGIITKDELIESIRELE